ncbi:MAG: hypothetical protein JW864_10235 [Spirochaetes bacterium]|nr:hypothetical protein [Spirochaetota bacterium]
MYTDLNQREKHDMDTCKYKPNCKLVGTSALVKLYDKKYCSGPLREECKRKTQYEQGKDVSPTLLPNGHHFDRRNFERRKLRIMETLQSVFNDRRIFKRRESDS